jgi:proteasome lid subunit RPN8/RPN11
VVTERTELTARIPAALLQELIDWARAGYPNEACGLLVSAAAPADGGAAERFVGLRNAAASPSRYTIDPQEQLEAVLAIDDAGEALWGIFHSHLRTPAEPSPTDVGLAFYPDALYLICSLAGELPVVQAWTIVGGEVAEVVVEVTP